ncbi:MAG TPA: peptidoglycan-associated lipoprotein Pal [Rhodospirillaceae bacterium]|nr:peptidoglycan-associated lipoprotein [Alphaproteobacteria bacterium]OUT39609.1 MAG: peptidoglycan-associated lipoprotein [Micavibrio sp. TMED2]HCI47780.1 peptidoglycan-associated lipoprotein Pal [Rhodospirillaceae bacterium]MAS49001.1 peptidoglycan-associated lipoprotein [Alphaproteobacteria bacterium]MAX97397.1 peptidoglycan-associated lipoprotein [Alphaproteobacteria bacterium]
MGTRLLSLFAAMLLVAACATNDPTIDGTGTGDGDSNTATDTRPRGPGPVAGSEEQFVVTVGDRVFFDTDQSSLSAEARNSLDNQAAWLNQYTTYSVVVEGHADERGTREYNLALGERRANAVRSYLIANGVAANRITTISYGKERPEVVGSNPSAWAQNRRGVTVLR